MQLVERHVIKRADPRFVAIDTATFASQNLYKAANYVVRRFSIAEGVYLNYLETIMRYFCAILSRAELCGHIQQRRTSLW